MSIPAKVNKAVTLVLVTPDGNTSVYPQAEIYASGGVAPLATIDLNHKAKGRYESTWTPIATGAFTAHFIVYADAGHSVEFVTYSREAEQIFVASTDTDDLAAMIVRLLGLVHENAFIDETIHDANGQLLSARLRIYDSKTNAQAAADGDSYSTGLVATYTIEAVYEGIGRTATYRMVKEP